MQKIYFSLLLSFLLILSACGSADLSLINEVKRFEPRWMSLSEQTAKIRHNLSITERRYNKDLDIVSPILNQKARSKPDLLRYRSEYGRVIKDRDELKEVFDGKYADLKQTVQEFSDWENKLMKQELDEEQAALDFQRFVIKHESLEKDIDHIYTELVKNIEKHNSILRRIASILGLFNNFNIDPK